MPIFVYRKQYTPNKLIFVFFSVNKLILLFYMVSYEMKLHLVLCFLIKVLLKLGIMKLYKIKSLFPIPNRS